MHLTGRVCNRGAIFAAASIFQTLTVFESKAGITQDAPVLTVLVALNPRCAVTVEAFALIVRTAAIS